jgi:DNA-binding Lrp family transcriptional regulator
MIATLKHCGLPEDIRRSGLVEKITPALKARGLSSSAINYLSKAFEHWTRDQDYTPNRVCGFWHKVSILAEKLSVTVRTVNTIERQLENAGLIKRTIMANGARDGQREEGEGASLRWLMGINLAPIVEMAAELIAEAESIRLHQQAKAFCQMEIRQVNKRIRQLNDETAIEKSQEILPSGRSAIIKDLDELEAILDALKAVENAFGGKPRSAKTSDQSEENDQPVIQTKQTKFLYAQEEVSEQVTFQQAIKLATEEFRECLEMYGDHSWRGIVQTAYQIGLSIGIDERTWQAACASLGRERTALCMILIQRNNGLPKQHPYHAKKPAACLWGMARSAHSGSFNLAGLIGAARGQNVKISQLSGRNCHAS